MPGHSNGLYISTDEGTTWHTVNNGILDTANITTIALKGDTIFAGCYFEGVFVSINNGTNWIASGLTNQSITSLAISGRNIYASSGSINNAGIYLSTNDGKNWTSVGLKDVYITTIAINGKNIFAGTYSAGIFLTTNNGMSWDTVNNGLPYNTEPAFNYIPIIYLAINGENIYAGTFLDGVWNSNDNGKSWSLYEY